MKKNEEKMNMIQYIIRGGEMNVGHIAKGTRNENWHLEWKSKHRIFRLGFFKGLTAGWESWGWRMNFNTLEKIGWILTRFVYTTKEIRGNQYRLFCFAFGWIYRTEEIK